jgi:hypothetical protein
MSNPWLSPVAQLKGFMMVFGNTVGMRMYREVFKPLAGFLPGSKEKGRIPAEEAFKYAMTFTLLLSAIYGTTMLKDVIKYGDEDSPTDELEGYDLLAYLLKSTNILGFGNVVIDALNSEQYGVPFPLSVAGPGPVKAIQLFESIGKMFQGNPKSLANFISKNTPIISELLTLGTVLAGLAATWGVLKATIKSIVGQVDDIKDDVTKIYQQVDNQEAKQAVIQNSINIISKDILSPQILKKQSERDGKIDTRIDNIETQIDRLYQ